MLLGWRNSFDEEGSMEVTWQTPGRRSREDPDEVMKLRWRGSSIADSKKLSTSTASRFRFPTEQSAWAVQGRSPSPFHIVMEDMNPGSRFEKAAWRSERGRSKAGRERLDDFTRFYAGRTAAKTNPPASHPREPVRRLFFRFAKSRQNAPASSLGKARGARWRSHCVI